MKRILIVDGDGHSRLMMESGLRGAGLEVFGVSGQQEARKRLELEEFSLLVAEVDLPDGDGVRFAKEILAERPDSLKLLFITRRAAVEDKIAGLEIGAEDYLTKPIYLREFVTRVMGIVKKAESERPDESGDEVQEFTGILSDGLLYDILDGALEARRTGRMELRRKGRTGALFFDDGRLVDAELEAHPPSEAALRLLCWNSGEFTIGFNAAYRREALISNGGRVISCSRKLRQAYREILDMETALRDVSLADLYDVDDAGSGRADLRYLLDHLRGAAGNPEDHPVFDSEAVRALTES